MEDPMRSVALHQKSYHTRQLSTKIYSILWKNKLTKIMVRQALILENRADAAGGVELRL
jgi:hypothetical protein